MKEIGEIAGRLVANPIELVAAANQEARPSFEGGREPVAKGVSPSSLPIAQASGRTEASNSGIGKTRGTDGDPAPRVEGGHVETTGRPAMQSMSTYGHRMVPALPYTDRSIVTVSSTTPHRESFARSAVIIDLVVWREVHGCSAASTSSSAHPKNSPKAKTMIQSF